MGEPVKGKDSDKDRKIPLSQEKKLKNIPTSKSPQLLQDCFKESNIRLRIHFFLDIRQVCIVSGVCQWWSTYIIGEKTQDSSLWLNVNLSICAPHAATDEGVTSLFRLHPNIEALDFKFCSKLTDAALENMARLLKNLRKLDIEGCTRKIGDKGISALAACTSLTSLNLNGCQKVTPAKLESVLTKCANIRELAVGGLNTLEDKNIAKILHHLPQLSRLSLNSCSKLSDNAIRLIAESTKLNLEELEVAYCAEITDEAIRHLSHHCKNLTSLNLYGCYKITDASLMYLGGYGGGKMKKLNLSMCHSITDKGIAVLVEGKVNYSNSLEWLELYDCTLVTNASIILLGQKCKKLKILGLFGLDRLEPSAIEKLLEVCNTLQRLDLGGCQQISSDFLRKINSKYPNLLS